MSILFLDDDLKRCASFKSSVPSAKIVTNVEDCIAEFERDKDAEWDIVLLDHDLNEETYVNPKSVNCGMEVVRWIIKNEPIIFRIIIHSYNTEAAEMMRKALKKAKYKVDCVPFNKINEKIKGLVV